MIIQPNPTNTNQVPQSIQKAEVAGTISIAAKLIFQKEIVSKNQIPYNMKSTSLVLSLAICLLCASCNSQKNNENSYYSNSSDDSYVNNTLSTGSNPYEEDSDIENDPYISNYLSTGALAYSDESSHSGNDSKISIITSSSSDCDVVVILKSGGVIVRNAYIEAGDSYSFSIPNGKYQVFFYEGRGWNPNKSMPNGQMGGFVADESFSKDSPVSLHYEELTYKLILQTNGNFSKKRSSPSEIFQ